MTTLQVGGHGDQVDPIAEAAARKATLAQFFLGIHKRGRAQRSGTPAVQPR
jgi:hypothetical protein